jgi:hypothetical protein
MGGIGLTGIMPLPDAAVLVSVLTLTNAAQMLLKGWRDVAWRPLGLVMLGSLPAVMVGFVLLHWLSGSKADLLRLAMEEEAAAEARRAARPLPPAFQPAKADAVLAAANNFVATAGLATGVLSMYGAGAAVVGAGDAASIFGTNSVMLATSGALALPRGLQKKPWMPHAFLLLRPFPFVFGSARPPSPLCLPLIFLTYSHLSISPC